MTTITEAKSEKTTAHKSSRLKSRTKGLTYSLETVTPDMARDYLETVMHQRKVDARVVANYAAAMKAGAWVVNGQPLIFDTEGHLIDGVQRLHACIQADLAFTTLVARNVHADTLHTIDQHRARSYVAVLESRGSYQRPASLVRLMGKLIRIENGTLGFSAAPISWSRFDRVLDANPELLEAVRLAHQYKGVKLHTAPLSVVAFMARRAGREKEFRDFLVDLDTADDDEATGFNGATNLLSTIEGMKAAGDVDVDQMIALGILAFNDYVEGVRKRRVYRWQPDRTPIKGAGDQEELEIEAGRVKATAKAKQQFRPNFGLPQLRGYPGLREGRIPDASKGDPVDARLMDELKASVSRSGAREVQVRMVQVTPALARQWLRDFNDGNRKIQPTQVDTIARDIKAGNWMVNAQPICFTEDPFAEGALKGNTRLLNGQHRLAGCIEADEPIEVPIASGIDSTAFATYDTHAKKTVYSTGGGAQADQRVLAGAARFQWRVDNGLKPNDRTQPSSSEIKATMDKHPGLGDYFAESRKKAVAEYGSSGVMTFLLYHTHRENEQLADEFFQDLVTGEHLTRDNPVLTLRERIKRTRNLEGDERGSRREVLTLLMQAWDAYKRWKAEAHAKA